jgi:thymidylate synthase (FAD)
MRVVKPNVEILTQVNGDEILKLIEQIGRLCYKSENKITEGSAKQFIQMLINNGHEAMIEHFNITVKFITDRGITHEIVRHRIASYAQESTRYCNYSNDKFGNEITIVLPSSIPCDNANLNDPDIEYSPEYYHWYYACHNAEISYFDLLEAGIKPQTARSVLPTCLKTEIVMTTNLREWRHFLKLRTSKADHPDIRILAIDLLHKLQSLIPVVFDDIEVEE